MTRVGRWCGAPDTALSVAPLCVGQWTVFRPHCSVIIECGDLTAGRPSHPDSHFSLMFHEKEMSQRLLAPPALPGGGGVGAPGQGEGAACAQVDRATEPSSPAQGRRTPARSPQGGSCGAHLLPHFHSLSLLGGNTPAPPLPKPRGLAAGSLVLSSGRQSYTWARLPWLLTPTLNLKPAPPKGQSRVPPPGTWGG